MTNTSKNYEIISTDNWMVILILKNWMVNLNIQIHFFINN